MQTRSLILALILLSIVAPQCAAAIIAGESRRPLTLEEYQRFGKSVGSLECLTRTDNVQVTTAFVVASNVISVSGHGRFELTRDPRNPRFSILTNQVALENCVFKLRDGAGRASRFELKSWSQCPGHTMVVDYANCDWALARLMVPVPDDIQPLDLLIASPQELAGRPIQAVGHHYGVKINGVAIGPKNKLFDSGHVRAKDASSPLFRYQNLLPYTVDTASFASGQPILLTFNGQVYVIGTHTADESRNPDAVNMPFNSSNHFNFGATISPLMIDKIIEMAPLNERRRLDEAKRRRLPSTG